MKRTAICILLLVSGVYVNAQTGFTNSGNLQLHSGGSISVGLQTFANSSGAALVNNGTLYIQGNFSNDQSSMSAGSGKLYLNGTGTQTLSGAQAFATNDLETNNSSGITLDNELSVSGVHTFNTGIIATTSTPHYLVYQAGASYTGDGNTKHVNGWVRKLGTTAFTFPVGNGTIERTIATTNLSASSTFDAKYEGGPTTNRNNLDVSLMSVDSAEYWTLNRSSGSATAQVAMNWDSAKVSFPNYAIADVRVAHYTGGTPSWTSEGGSASGIRSAGTITSGVISTFSPFTLGSISVALPLNFLDLTAQRRQGNTLVQWQTAQESNVDHYEVERSDNNATAFRKIGAVSARNSDVATQYEYIDGLSLDGTAFYRIRSVDNDGKIKYSAIVSVSDNNRNGSFNIINNPAYRAINLSTPSNYRGTYDYELTGTGGQILQKGKLTTQFSNVVAIPLQGNVVPGVYILRVHNAMQRFAQQVVIADHP